MDSMACGDFVFGIFEAATGAQRGAAKTSGGSEPGQTSNVVFLSL